MRDCSEGVREEPAHIGVFAKTKTETKHPGSMNIKRLLLIKEKQTFHVNEFSRFLCMGKMQESGLIEIIPLVCTLTI